MTFFFMLQGVLLLVVINVMVGRFAHRRNSFHREQLVTDETAIRQMDYKILEAQRHEQNAIQKIQGINDSIAAAEKQLELAEKELDAARNAPPELYFIFDRLEPRQGVIWEVAVSRSSDVPMGARMSAVWRQPRRYLITAKSPKEAQDRAGQRFFEKTGLKIDSVSVCQIFAPKRPENGEGAASGDGETKAQGRALERARSI